MDENYFVISTNDDGDISIDPLCKDELLARINDPDYYGIEATDLPSNDPMQWGRRLVIIKGEVVIPTPKKVVEVFDIE